MAEPAPASTRPRDGGRVPVAVGGIAARLAVWVVLVGAFVLFVGFGRVPLHYNLKIGDLTSAPQAPVARAALSLPHSQRILRVWLDQADRLPRTAHPEVLRDLYFVGLPLLVVIAAAAIWLALMAVGRVSVEPAALASPEANGLGAGETAPIVEPVAEPAIDQVPAAPRPDEPA